MILAATAAVSCILVWRVNSVEIALFAWSASCSSVKGWAASSGKIGRDPTPVVYNSSLSVLRHCLNAARLSRSVTTECRFKDREGRYVNTSCMCGGRSGLVGTLAKPTRHLHQPKGKEQLDIIHAGEDGRAYMELSASCANERTVLI